MRRTTIVAVGLATLLVVGGCSSSDDTSSGSTPREMVQDLAPSDEATAAVPESKPTFGEAWTIDGLTVTVSLPQEFTPSESAYGPVDGYTNLLFTVSVTNGSDQDWTPADVSATVLSGGKEGKAVYDYGQDIDTPVVTVPPGKSIEFPLAFSVADPTDISMTITPDFLSGDRVTLSTD